MSNSNAVALQAGWLAAKDDQIRALEARVKELEEALKYARFDAETARECLLNPGGAKTAAVFVEAIEDRARSVLSQEDE